MNLIKKLNTEANKISEEIELLRGKIKNIWKQTPKTKTEFITFWKLKGELNQINKQLKELNKHNED